MPNVSFRLVKDPKEVSRWYPFWIGTMVGFAIVFLSFYVAILQIRQAGDSRFLEEQMAMWTMTMPRRELSRARASVSFEMPVVGTVLVGSVEVKAAAKTRQGSIAKVTFTADGAEFAVFSAAPYASQWDTTRVANGEHILGVIAVDSFGYMALTQQKFIVAN